MSTEPYFRLILRFTNGDSSTFILREPINTGALTEKSRFALVRSYTATSGEPTQVFLASLADISFIKTEQVDPKDKRHRVAGITGGLSSEDQTAPEAIATIEFL